MKKQRNFDNSGMTYETNLGWHDLLNDQHNSVAKFVVHHQ